MAHRLYVGAASENVIINCVPEEDQDFTTVHADQCTIEVRKADGTWVSWPAIVSNITITTIRLTYKLNPDGSDIPIAGLYKFFAKMPIAGGGFYRSEAFDVPVLDAFDTTYR